MRNLIRFIDRYSFFFLFLLFEVLAFTLLLKNNHYQQSAFLNATNELTGSLYNSYNDWEEYINLKEVNAALSEELRQQKRFEKNSLIKLFGQQIAINDTLFKRQYDLLSAQVINNSTHRQNNYITLNKGSLNGIEPGMGIVGLTGVVGIVKNVSEHFSSAVSVLHRNSKISAKLQRENYIGSMQWDGKNYLNGILNDIPNHANIKIGDTIVTSGYSSTFPPNIPIAQILEFDRPEGENFYQIKVKFINDFKQLSSVYVVKNLMLKEQKEIENQTVEEHD